MKLSILKKAFIFSFLFHFIFIVFFYSLKDNEITKDKITIDLNTTNTEKVFEIDDITDDEILARSSKIQTQQELLQEKADESLLKTQEVLKDLREKIKQNNLKLKEDKAKIEKERLKLKKLADKSEKEKARIKELEKEKERLKKKSKLDKEKKIKAKLAREKKERAKKIAQKKKTEKLYNTKLKKYIKDITFSFQKNWIIPLNVEKNWNCKVVIKQDKLGKMINYKMDSKCPSDPDFISSIRKAIKSSFPLKKAPKELKYSDIQEITLDFKVHF